MTTTVTTSLKSVNPATLELLGQVPITSAVAIPEIVQSAQHAFAVWSSVPLSIRLKKIRDFANTLIEHKADIAQAITRETGKPITESYLAELSGTLDACTWLSKNANSILAIKEMNLTSPLMLGKEHYLRCEPLGIVGIISPWNYPFSIPVMSILMALAAGNVVILKPSEKTPLIGLKIAELFTKAGFPLNVVQVVTGDGQTGAQLAAQKLGRLIFTGSVNTGIKIISTSALNITPLTLELGGKDAAIVLPDAPIERTAQALVWGAFTNAGQACASIERVYLVRGANSGALLNKIVELTSKLKIGDPLLDTTEIGPLIDVQQFDHVIKQVQQATGLGAKVLCGGDKISHAQLENQGLVGYFYQPTVLTNVTQSMDIMQAETFGPILPIMLVDSIEEAIKLANDSVYGLTASVWSVNIQRAQTIANKLHVGTVFINDCLYTHASAALPWGGVKNSGFGRSHSDLGLLDLVNIKHISIDHALWFSRLWWYPYFPAKLKTVLYGLDYMHGTKNKLNNLLGFVSNLFKTK